MPKTQTADYNLQAPAVTLADLADAVTRATTVAEAHGIDTLTATTVVNINMRGQLVGLRVKAAQ